MQHCNDSVNFKVLLAILIVSACLRLWGAFDITGYTGDESFHVPSAISLGQYGTPLSSNWTHPPAGALILLGTITLFGDNPVGWRIGGIVFGTVSVGLLYLVAFRLYRNEMAALLAATLLAMDPFHIYFSRTTFMEIPVLCFFLMFLYFMLKYAEDGSRWSLPLAGVALGLTAATKSYFVCSMLLVIGYAWWKKWQQKDGQATHVLDFLCYLLCLPVAIYLLSYYHWFGRGFTLQEFFQMRGDALWTLRNITIDSFENKWFLEVGGQPWEWFVKPIVFGYQFETNRYLLEINNFPIRLFSLFSLIALTVHGWRRRLAPLLVPPILFASVYLLFLLLNRPMSSSSALVVLPFAYLALARAVVLLEEQYCRACRLSLIALVLIVFWGAYLYPLATGRVVSDSLYSPILSSAKIMRMQ